MKMASRLLLSLLVVSSLVTIATSFGVSYPSALAQALQLSLPYDYGNQSVCVSQAWQDPAGHNGIDFAAQYNSNCMGVPRQFNVIGAAAGSVKSFDAGASGYGRYQRVDHGNGVETLYAHLDPTSPWWQDWTPVSRGRFIGVADNTGNSRGHHLHFEVHSPGYWSPVNPNPYYSGYFSANNTMYGNPGTSFVVDHWYSYLAFPVVGQGTYDDPASAVGYSTAGNRDWTHASGWPSAYKTTVSWSNGYGDAYSLSFTGSRITWVYTMAWNRGSANVYIDGNLRETWSQYAPTAGWQVARTYDLPSGNHTIRVVLNGDGYVDLDAFAVNIPGSWVIYDDPDASIAYSGSWVHATEWSGPYNGTVSWSNSTGSYAQKSFTGQLVRYRFTKAYNRGKANITIDGVSRGQVDLYNSTTLWQEKVTYFAGPGSHTFRTTVSGQSSGTGYYIDVDTIDVMQ